MAEGSVDPSLGNSAVDIKYMVENVYRDLIIRLVPCGSFIARMCFPESKTEEIMKILSDDNNLQQMAATTVFLDTLKDSKEPKDYLLFVQLLEEKRYDYVAKVLKGESTLDEETHKEQLRIIQFFSQDISEKIDFNVMFPKLVQDDWLEEEDALHLQRLANTNGKIATGRWLALVVLPRRKENWFKLFLQLLRDHGYEELANWIHEPFLEEDQQQDQSSEMSVDEEDEVGMNIVTAFGDGYKDHGLNDFDMPPLAKMLKCIGDDRTKTAYNDHDINMWREDAMKVQTQRKDIRDDMSTETDSTCEDNTIWEIDKADLAVTLKMLAECDKIQRLENRPYQDELVRAAANGQNVIIVAPTGWGKTVVALRIIQEHLEKMKGHGLQSKIAFFANELTLVDQQHELCQGHLDPKYKCTKIVGETKYKTTVVGLTASVGVGKMKESEGTQGALTHIIHLCANMDAKGGIATVREHKDSLAEYANHVESEIEIAKERISDPFKDCIVGCIMEPIEELIIEKHSKSEGKLKHIKDIAKEVHPCLAKGTSWYTQWLGKLHSDKFLRIKDAGLRRFFMACINHLRIYNQAQALNVDCRTHDAMNYIKSWMSTIRPAEQYRTHTDEKLYSFYTSNFEKMMAESSIDVSVNPKLILLRSLVVDQFKKKRDSRILVLVKTRYLAHALIEWMKEDPGMRKLSPVVVTGCGATTDRGGMTRNQQIEAVKNFKWSTSRIAVATSVAEEGMDVTECSRVIRYEYVSNEIGMIQARGRASRVPDGTYVTLTSNDDMAKKEESNMRLEKIMDEAVRILQETIQKDPLEFHQQIDEH